MRINGWQRIGIVISIAWMIGAGITYRNHEMNSWREQANFRYNFCIQHKTPDRPPCLEQSAELLRKMYEPDWSNIAFVALAPALLGWLIVYMMLGISRWVKAGFNSGSEK